MPLERTPWSISMHGILEIRCKLDIPLIHFLRAPVIYKSIPSTAMLLFFMKRTFSSPLSWFAMVCRFDHHLFQPPCSGSMRADHLSATSTDGVAAFGLRKLFWEVTVPQGYVPVRTKYSDRTTTQLQIHMTALDLVKIMSPRSEYLQLNTHKAVRQLPLKFGKGGGSSPSLIAHVFASHIKKWMEILSLSPFMFGISKTNSHCTALIVTLEDRHLNWHLWPFAHPQVM